MSGITYEVPTRTRKQIRTVTQLLRVKFEISDPYLPIVEILECYHLVDPAFTYDIRPANEMGENHGLTYPEQHLIEIREDVYEGACEGHGRDRMTIGHEFGHLVLHSDVALARRIPTGQSIPAYRDSEWQAKCFAGEWLISADHLDGCTCFEDLVMRFGVSYDAAKFQWRKFQEERLVPKRKGPPFGRPLF